MSRVYEALRQSELEKGLVPTVLDPDSFLSVSPTATPAAVEVGAEALVWDEIPSLFPAVEEESRVVMLTDDNGLGAEKFRLLRSRIRNLRERQQLKRLVITSAVPDEGKTLVALNLAVCLAKHTHEKILLLEGDLRKPLLAQRCGIQHLSGLVDWSRASEPISRYLCRFDNLQLWVLLAGSVLDNPVTILQSARFLGLYKQLSAYFDWILIDAPPLLPMADVSFWSRQADGLLLVVREGKTPKSVLQKGLDTLDNPNVIGIVLNDVRQVESRYYRHYYRQYGVRKTVSKPRS
jgi:capsular exopolysaccharide synthesis family protein